MDQFHKMREPHYLGSYKRLIASLIDGLLLSLIVVPPLLYIYGLDYFSKALDSLALGPADLLLTWILPAILVISYWIKTHSTPGKMLYSAIIVDATTYTAPSATRYLSRYLAYYIATLPLGLGFIGIVFDKRKQGWHDKIARTVVIIKMKESQ